MIRLLVVVVEVSTEDLAGPENTGILGSRIPGSQGVLEAASKKKEEKRRKNGFG